MLKSITHFLIILIVISLSSCSSKEDEAKNMTQYNFTKNILWDNPELSDLQQKEFYDLVAESEGQQMLQLIHDCDDMIVPRERAEEVFDSLKNTNSIYKGFLQTLFLNYSMCLYPDDKLTKEKATAYLDKLYAICEGDSPVPQSMFLIFWNNAMISMSNVRAYDQINIEAQKLLRICEKQNMPLGSMFAHVALGYCLMDEADNFVAQEQFMQADSVAQRYFPTVLGENWKDQDLATSDILSIYASMKLLQLRCASGRKDTAWIRKNEAEIFNINSRTTDVIDNATVLTVMAQYYNDIGNEKMYQKMITESANLLQKHNMMKLRKENSVYFNCCAFYYQARVEHALKLHNTAEAEKLIEEMPDFFKNNGIGLSVELYRQQGRIHEAFETLTRIHKNDLEKLNGRNRSSILAIANSTIIHDKEMQLMQVKIDHANAQVRYNIILLALAIALIMALTYFLIHQRRMNRRLNHALHAAGKANAAKDIFLKNMTHELHTPLNHISGFAQILADRSTPLDEESTRQMADAINEGSTQLTNILDNVIEVTDKLTKLDKLEDVETILK